MNSHECEYVRSTGETASIGYLVKASDTPGAQGLHTGACSCEPSQGVGLPLTGKKLKLKLSPSSISRTLYSGLGSSPGAEGLYHRREAVRLGVHNLRRPLARGEHQALGQARPEVRHHQGGDLVPGHVRKPAAEEHAAARHQVRHLLEGYLHKQPEFEFLISDAYDTSKYLPTYPKSQSGTLTDQVILAISLAYKELKLYQTHIPKTAASNHNGQQLEMHLREAAGSECRVRAFFFRPKAVTRVSQPLNKARALPCPACQHCCASGLAAPGAQLLRGVVESPSLLTSTGLLIDSL